ncbi:PA0069 family radical SAM protein [Phenylobacterium sp. SCN 70-31]|uniref:PA0069 family radical SAM protein n=1 Tax=Phenylobacterium sp. SCN 70-31 TaxID=1660129 RepID=UPI00086A4B1A|nr:PA0069 family radical SAM protein [Phenylobacterium sp. SCN 70-31]ODT86665.1 MAG: DNA repair photolyase [Phenylobacterium sp. SCN 70-31]
MSQTAPPMRGRGARSNASGRYESEVREAFDDGWTRDDAEATPLRTEVSVERARRIISHNDSPDVGFSASINPYRGCEHGCIYCYARPSHAYMGLSPGLDFESRIFVKPDAARLLERELSRPSYKPELIHIGGNTDPYQPQERTQRITRGVIEVMLRFRHPFSVITKSALVVRDLDLLAEAATMNLARVAISVTTLDRKLARSMEPRAATPAKRLDAIARLAAAGVPVTVMFAPAIPGLNDHEMEAVLERAAGAGASGAGYVVLRLPLEIKDLFREWLDTGQPDRARRVMSLVRQMRGGKDYDMAWGRRMRGEGPIADLLSIRFKAARRRYGLDRGWPPADLSRFRVPLQAGGQLDLFG